MSASVVGLLFLLPLIYAQTINWNVYDNAACSTPGLFGGTTTSGECTLVSDGKHSIMLTTSDNSASFTLFNNPSCANDAITVTSTTSQCFELGNSSLWGHVTKVTSRTLASATRTAQLGESCGGNTATAAVCAPGLTCVPVVQSVREPALPFGDVGGICARTPIRTTAQLGEICGGNTANAAVCATGLKCVSVAHNPSVAVGDVGGVCQRAPARLGQPCGGNTVNAAVCASGLKCSPVGHSNVPVGDVGGVCRHAKPVAKLGEHCGGNTVNAPVCASGLKCAPIPHHPGGPFGDVGGICRRKHNRRKNPTQTPGSGQ